MDDGRRCGAPHVFEILAEEHALQQELCDLLEAIADSLPHEFDGAHAKVAVALLQGAIPPHTRLEEEALFPVLLTRLDPQHTLARAMTWLEEDHAREAALVSEVTDALATLMSGAGRPVHMEALGYMLRGLFDTLRRHIAFEDTVVFPAAREMLTRDDLVFLQDWIMRSGHPRCCRQSILTLRSVRQPAGACITCPDAVVSA